MCCAGGRDKTFRVEQCHRPRAALTHQFMVFITWSPVHGTQSTLVSAIFDNMRTRRIRESEIGRSEADERADRERGDWT